MWLCWIISVLISATASSADPVRLFNEVFSITTILLPDCREPGLVFCRRVVVNFRNKGAEELNLPYGKVLQLVGEGPADESGFYSFQYRVSWSLISKIVGLHCTLSPGFNPSQCCSLIFVST